jgi:WD40 repeat protein
LRVLDGVSGKLLWSDDKNGHRFGALAFSPDGKQLAAGVDRKVNVYDARSGRVRRECSEPGGGMVAVCFSADGTRVAAGGVDHNLYVWDLGEPKRDVVLPLQVRAPVEPQVDALTFDGKSGSLVAFIRREERPGFFESWQNPPPPGITITKITGSLIVRREPTPGGKTTMLLETEKMFSKVRFAQDARRFVQSNAGDSGFGLWAY